jgi:hypothetical protein
MKRISRLLAIGLVLAAGAAAGPAHADKLVVFKNGKALKAKSVTKDGIWLKCEFEGNNFISVKSASVESIEEAAVGSNEGDLRFNKVAASSGSFAPNRPPAYTDEGHQEAQAQAAQQQSQDEEAAMAAAVAEEAEARRQAGTAVGGNVNGLRAGQRGSGIGQPNQNGLNRNNANGFGQFQPLNQANTPFQGRGGITPRDQQRRLSRFGVQPQQQQPQQPEGNQEN